MREEAGSANGTGKKGRGGVRWFCGEKCREVWRWEVGEVGREAVVLVEEVVRKALERKAEGGTAGGGVGREEMERAWEEGERVGMEVVRLRVLAVQGGKAGRRNVVRAQELVDELTEDDDEDVLRFLLDGITRRYAYRVEEEDESEQGGAWAAVRSLVPSLSPYEGEMSGRKALRSHVRMYHALLLSLPLALLPFVTLDTILVLLTRDAGNSFGVWDDLIALLPSPPLSPTPPTSPFFPSIATLSISPPTSPPPPSTPAPPPPAAPPPTPHPRGPLLAYSLHPPSSFFNHSCAPNLSKTRHGLSWSFTTSREVEMGEELCISYLGGGELAAREERRGRLRDGWGFECGCAKCVEEGDEEEVGI